jgi:hypothetical protein
MISRRCSSLVVLPFLVLVARAAAAQAPPPAAAAAAPAAAPTVPRTLDVPDNALVAGGKAPEVELVYTGDVIGYIEPCG